MKTRLVGSYFGAMCAAIAMALSAMSPSTSFAALVNGGFETGDLTGWTVSGNTGFAGVTCPGPGPIVGEGSCSAFLGAVGSLGFLSQSFAANPGDVIDIGFAWRTDGGTPSEFSLELDGVSLFDVLNPAAMPAMQFLTFSGIANPTAGVSTLSFNERNDPGFIFLDAVTASVPEPASIVLLGIGLAGLGFSRRKRVTQ